MNSHCPTIMLLMAALVSNAGCSPVLAKTHSRAAWSGVVTYVVDGDTIRVQAPKGGKPVSVRIEGIDAPEICQPGGTLSRDTLKRRLLGKRVLVYSKVHDDYGRLVARIVSGDVDHGQWMVANGLAWSYRHRNNSGPYAMQQRQAQTAGLGLFSSVQAVAPVYPGSFRKQHGRCYL